MDILGNPFNVLSASPFDSRATIKASFDALSLKVDQNCLQEAQSALTNPRKRLAAELSWLPGVDPRLYPELLKKTQLSSRELLDETDLPPLARANLLTSALQGMVRREAPNVALWVLQIARAFERIDAKALLETVNEGRRAARFALVSDQALIEDELREKRGYFRQAVYAELKKLSTFPEISFALARAAEASSDSGRIQGLVLLDDLVDSYEVDAQKFLDKEEKAVKTLVERLRASARRLIDPGPQPNDSGLQPIVNELISALKQWDFYAQPIQVSARSRGLGHPASVALGKFVRSIAVDLNHTYAKYDLSMQLTQALQTVFAEVEEVAELTAEDAKALSEIERKRKRQNAQKTSSRTQNTSSRTQSTSSRAQNASSRTQSTSSWTQNTPSQTQNTSFRTQDASSGFSDIVANLFWLALAALLFHSCFGSPTPTGGTSVRDEPRSFSPYVASSDDSESESESESDSDLDESDDDSPSRTGPSPATDSPFPLYFDAKPNLAAEPTFTQPPIGSNNLLSASQIRWCMRENIRLEAKRNVIETSEGLNEFNNDVRDYNARCGSYRYQISDELQARKDVEEKRLSFQNDSILEAQLQEQSRKNQESMREMELRQQELIRRSQENLRAAAPNSASPFPAPTAPTWTQPNFVSPSNGLYDAPQIFSPNVSGAAGAQPGLGAPSSRQSDPLGFDGLGDDLESIYAQSAATIAAAAEATSSFRPQTVIVAPNPQNFELSKPNRSLSSPNGPGYAPFSYSAPAPGATGGFDADPFAGYDPANYDLGDEPGSFGWGDDDTLDTD